MKEAKGWYVRMFLARIIVMAVLIELGVSISY
jgi:hypothetical protein